MSEEGLADPVEMHAIFRGRVQGVGFRATVKHNADRLGILGCVKNLSDGTVEVNATAPRSLLELLVRNLQADAGLGEVESVTMDFSEARREFDSFTINF